MGGWLDKVWKEFGKQVRPSRKNRPNSFHKLSLDRGSGTWKNDQTTSQKQLKKKHKHPLIQIHRLSQKLLMTWFCLTFNWLPRRKGLIDMMCPRIFIDFHRFSSNILDLYINSLSFCFACWSPSLLAMKSLPHPIIFKIGRNHPSLLATESQLHFIVF